MNIEVKTVTYQGAWSGAWPDTPCLALADHLPGPRSARSRSPGCVIS